MLLFSRLMGGFSWYDKGLDVGGSYYDGVGNYLVNTTGAKAKNKGRTRWGAELGYEWQGLSLHSEHLKGKDNVITKEGYYVQAAYYLLSQKFQAIARFDNYDPNKDKADDVSTLYTLGLIIILIPLPDYS